MKRRYHLSQETRSKMSKVRTGKRFSQLHREHISNALKGRVLTQEWKLKISKSSVGLSSRGMSGKRHTQDSRAKMRQRSLSPGYTENVIHKSLKTNQTVRPTKPEAKVLELLRKTSCDTMKYTGDRSFWIGGKNPDFVDESRKLIIEVMGCYWHGCPKHCPDQKKSKLIRSRIQLFRNLGYSVLILWECQVSTSKSQTKILKFVS